MSFIAGSRLVVTDTTSPADRLHASAFIQSNPTTSIQNLQKPLYRKDIFYSGSVMNVTHIKSHMSLKSYVASVTSIPQEVRLINFHLQNHINTKHVLVAVPVLTNIVGGFCPPPPSQPTKIVKTGDGKTYNIPVQCCDWCTQFIYCLYGKHFMLSLVTQSAVVDIQFTWEKTPKNNFY